MKLSKTIFLILLIATPITIIVFLHSFGNNRFDIPIYYSNGVFEREPPCEISKDQHFVPKVNNLEYKNHLSILHFSAGREVRNANKYTFARLCEAKNEIIQLIFINKQQDELLNHCDLPDVKLEDIQSVMDCSFMANWNELVLIDGNARIRGYYNLDRKDIDRLFTEIEILKQNKEYE